MAKIKMVYNPLSKKEQDKFDKSQQEFYEKYIKDGKENSMTDKVQKIREEVEKLFEQIKNSKRESDSGAFYQLKELLEFIDSMQEEPVSEFLKIELMIESYKQRLMLQANGLSGPLIDMCLASYKHGINEILDTLNLSNVQRTVKNWKKSVSEPSEKLAETYLAVFNRKFPILPSLKGKQLADYKNFLNKCQQIFGLKEWGIRPIQSKLFEKLTLLWAAWGAEHLQGIGRQDEKEQDIPISEELEKVVEEIVDPTVLNAYGTKELARRLRNTICSTSVSEDLGKYINELSKQFPEVSFAKLSRIAVRVSRWQRNQDVKNKLPKVINRTELDEYAYQCAYDMSNDWAIENPTWHDVEDACKLGAKWQKEKDDEEKVLTYKHGFDACKEYIKEHIKEVLLSEVLPCFMHGGEADEVVAMLDYKIMKDE